MWLTPSSMPCLPEISICSSDLFHSCFGGAQNLITTSQHVRFTGLFQLFQSDRQLVLVFMLGVTVEACVHDNFWPDIYIGMQGGGGRNHLEH